MSSKKLNIFDSSFDSYGEALDKYLEYKELSKTWLAERLMRTGQKLSSMQSQISRWTSGEPVSRSYQKRINTLLDISIAQNNTGKWIIKKGRRGANRVNDEPAPYGTSVESKSATVLIPFYKQVKPSAGGGSIIVPDDESDKIYVSLPRSYVIRKLHANPSEVIILEIWNDSMEPVIRNGDVVFITRDIKPLQDGEIYILRVGESLLCKYIHVLPGNRLKVSSANSRFPDFEVQLGDESQESFEIYGRIVGHLHSRL